MGTFVPEKLEEKGGGTHVSYHGETFIEYERGNY